MNKTLEKLQDIGEKLYVDAYEAVSKIDPDKAAAKAEDGFKKLKKCGKKVCKKAGEKLVEIGGEMEREE